MSARTRGDENEEERGEIVSQRERERERDREKVRINRKISRLYKKNSLIFFLVLSTKTLLYIHTYVSVCRAMLCIDYCFEIFGFLLSLRNFI